MPSTDTLIWIAAVVCTYLLGGIPFGLMIGLAKGVDVRQHGSKNIGASNVGRTLGRKFGVITFALDMLKGFLPVLIAGFVLGTIGKADMPPFQTWSWLAFGLAAVIGHTYSPYLKFKGGKGVATGFGALLAMYPMLTIPAIMAIGTWAISVRLTRYIGFSSCVAGLSMPVFALFMPTLWRFIWLSDVGPRDGELLRMWPYVTVSTLVGLLVVWRHQSNLVRMMNGTEPKVKTKAERAALKAQAALAAQAAAAQVSPGASGKSVGGATEAAASAPSPAGMSR